MVNTGGQITKTELSAPDTPKSKKKRPRQRVRSRNKAVRNAIANLSIAKNQVESLLMEQIKNQAQNSPLLETTNQILEQTAKVCEALEMQTSASARQAEGAAAVGKARELIIAEREAKKLAKQFKRMKSVTGESIAIPSTSLPIMQQPPTVIAPDIVNEPKRETAKPFDSNSESTEKSREQIKAEREAKKLAKQAAKMAKSSTAVSDNIEGNTQKMNDLKITENVTNNHEKKKPELTKAERRALQEAQRAAKAQAQGQAQAKKPTVPMKLAASKPAVVAEAIKTDLSESNPISPAKNSVLKSKECKVKLFNHLESSKRDVNLFINNAQIHPSISRLGEQYAQRTIVGSNSRCIAFLNALKMVIQDFETPPKKEFARSLEVTIKNCVEHLQQCRPLAVSVCNAYKHINNVLTQLSTDKPETDLKENLCHFIETYIENQIGKAAQAISSSLQEKIIDGDVILTFGCSSLIHFICEEAQKRQVDFRVIIVDSRPFYEGQELLRRLSASSIPCTYVLINAVCFVMPEATKVLLGAHALLSNGYVMARTGTAQVALVARSFNVPVLVCCETHKFSERFQTDAIVYNELGNPDDLVISDKCSLTNWQAKGKMAPLNLNYDITPPELVTAVVTEVSILPCTSVPVILRIKPTEIGYYS